MARVNIEESIFRKDPFADLVLTLNSKTLALGVLVEAFFLAQEHYLSTENERLIPMGAWARFKWADQMITAGAAVALPNGIYVRGSKAQFAWLLQKQSAGKSTSPAKLDALAKARATKKALNGSKRDSTQLNVSEAPPLPPSLEQEKTTTTGPSVDFLKQAQEAWKIYGETLTELTIPPRPISQIDELSLVRAIKSLGYQNVLDALEGPRHEKSDEKYSNFAFVSLDYCLHKNPQNQKSNWERLGNLTRAARKKLEDEKLADEEARG